MTAGGAGDALAPLSARRWAGSSPLLALTGPQPPEEDAVLTIGSVVLHLMVSLALIFLILMHSGKGGGLSDMFGGSVGQAAAGSTVVEKNLDRITITVAIIFTFTTMTLALRLQ